MCSYWLISSLRLETNIMVGTHADSLVAEAVLKGITGFDLDLAYAAVYKDATVPPVDDDKISYEDREMGVGDVIAVVKGSKDTEGVDELLQVREK